MILLDEEEMRAICYGDDLKHNVTCEIPIAVEYAIKAQLKKVVEFLNRKTIELASGGHRRIVISYEDWQSLLKEVNNGK